jgi:ABC-type uncharacterized transport system substrate-binding protein
MRRRDFIIMLAIVAASPRTASAKIVADPSRIGILLERDSIDPQIHPKLLALTQSMATLGYSVNIQDTSFCRSNCNDVMLTERQAIELLEALPSVVLATGPLAHDVLLRQNPKVPVVYRSMVDPFGFGMFAPDHSIWKRIAHKSVELLRSVSPEVSSVLAISHEYTAPREARIVLESLRGRDGIEVTEATFSSELEIDLLLSKMGALHDAILVLPDPGSLMHSRRIVSKVLENRLLAVFPSELFAHEGRKLCCGIDVDDAYGHFAALDLQRALTGEIRPSKESNWSPALKINESEML